MALFITKINTTGTNFPYRCKSQLASTLSKCRSRQLQGSSQSFLALQDNKIHYLNVIRRSSKENLLGRFLKFFLGFWVSFCSQSIINFHNARGHYGEILISRFYRHNSMEGCWLVIMGRPFTRAWVGFEPGSTLKGNCHELRMHLRRFVCDNMPGFLATFRSRNLLFCLELSLSPSYTGGFSLHRCRRESNLKSSGCLFQVNCSWQFPFNTFGYSHELGFVVIWDKLQAFTPHQPGSILVLKRITRQLRWPSYCVNAHRSCRVNDYRVDAHGSQAGLVYINGSSMYPKAKGSLDLLVILLKSFGVAYIYIGFMRASSEMRFACF